MRKLCAILIMYFISVSICFSENPLKHAADAVEMRVSIQAPAVNYVLKIDTADLSSLCVEVNMKNVPDTFHVAMFAHPEYDDRYWRFVKDMYVEGKNGMGNIVREDSALWLIVSPGGEAVLHYRI